MPSRDLRYHILSLIARPSTPWMGQSLPVSSVLTKIGGLEVFALFPDDCLGFSRARPGSFRHRVVGGCELCANSRLLALLGPPVLEQLRDVVGIHDDREELSGDGGAANDVAQRGGAKA